MIDDKNADDEGDDEDPTQEELDQAVEDADDDLPATFLPPALVDALAEAGVKTKEDWDKL